MKKCLRLGRRQLNYLSAQNGILKCKPRIAIHDYKISSSASRTLFAVFFTEFINTARSINNPLFAGIKRVT
jgi:hypothetical protein